MRILIAHSFYRIPGGEDRYVHQQVDLLRERHDVRLLARENDALGTSALTAARMVYSADERRRVGRAVRGFRPDVVHLHNAYPALGPAVHLAARRHGLPLVMTVHNFRLRCPNGLMYTRGAPCRRCESGNYLNALVHDCFPTRSQAAVYATALWTHRFPFRLDEEVSLFVAPSRFMRDRLVEWGIAAERVEVVRNFTDAPAGTSDPGEHGLYLGRLSPEKGLDVLVDALAEAGDPPFRFVGTGPARADLEALVARHRLRNVCFVGQVDREGVRDELSRARYVAFTSAWDENAPLAALEAMTAGRPLIVTRTGGLPELVERGGGVMVEVGDVAAMAGAIRQLMNDGERCRTLGGEALAWALAESRPASHLERLEAAYRRVASLPSPPLKHTEVPV